MDVRPELLLYSVEEGAIVFHQRRRRSVWRKKVSAAMLNALIWLFLAPHLEATEAVSQETSCKRMN